MAQDRAEELVEKIHEQRVKIDRLRSELAREELELEHLNKERIRLLKQKYNIKE